MGRQPIIKDEELINLIDQYRLQNPVGKIKYSEVERFCNSIGVLIPAGTIKKKPFAVDYIKKINANDIQTYSATIGAYIPLDIDGFFRKNYNNEKMRSAIIDREKIYADLAIAAGHIRNEYIKYKDSYEKLLAEYNKLQSAYEKKLFSNENISNLKEQVNRLNNIINKYVYPEIAQMLIDSSFESEVVSHKAVTKFSADTNTNIDVFNNTKLNEIFKEFDDEE